MPFINGYASGDDIKIELFSFEPEQISDLIIVPLPEGIAVLLSGLFASGTLNNYSIDSRWINLPFSTNVTETGRIQPDIRKALLFQRFNPYNKPFADDYSKKLFDFLYQFANAYVLDKSGGFCRTVNTFNKSIIRDIDLISYKQTYYFYEQTINTQNLGLTIELSYYYAERIDEPYNQDYFAKYYDYPLIINNCIRTEFSRQWLLNFDTFNSNGESFKIRDDILIGSLVINFIDKPDLNLYWTNENKEYIFSQIPSYYLYDNLDNFFNELTNEIINIVPHVFEDIEFIEKTKIDILYSRINTFNVTTTEEIYKPPPFDLKAGLIIYANNNNWNNTYNWVDVNGTIYNDFIQHIYLILTNERAALTIDENGNIIGEERRIVTNFVNHSITTGTNIRPFLQILPKSNYSYNLDSVNHKAISRNTISKWYYNSIIAQLIYNTAISYQIVNEHGYTYDDINIPIDYYLRKSYFYYNFYYSTRRYDSTAFLQDFEYYYITPEIIEINDMDGVFYTFNNTPPNYSNIPDYFENAKQSIINAHEECTMANCDLEDIKKEIKEIHRALDAGIHGNLPDGSEGKRINNLGTKIDLIAKVLGLNFDSNLNLRETTKVEIEVEDGIDTEILPGYLYERFGVIQDVITQELTPGIIYKNISNKLVPNGFNEDDYDIEPGTINLCHSIPEYIERFREDLDKSLNLQEIGAAYIPNADGSGKVCYFEGLGTLLIEVAWMLSSFSESINTIEISSLISQAVLYEVLKAFGQPITIKNFDIKNANPNNDSGVSKIFYPGLSIDAPSSLTQTLWILQNLQPLIASVTSIMTEDELNLD